jgi:pyrimidine-nucleoside phosphorylase
MLFTEIIEKKRDKGKLNTEEIEFWIEHYVKDEIPDYQVSSLLMAIVLNGMDHTETAALTKAMLYSGSVYDLSSIAGVKVDKHSTGGVGDKTSLALGPMVAACGAKMAKMSGRGLGHTGGTLDKLESIPGFQVGLDEGQFIKQVNEIGIALIGQTTATVPADKKLYALRDVTGTVPSVPLISSSIMSKKLASGSDTILLDVKYGDGAFMDTAEAAVELAETMIQIGESFDRSTKAIITSMDQPLGFAIGNALEVREAIDTLQGKGPADFVELCLSCGEIMLVQAKIAKDKEEARGMLEESIDSGAAFQALLNMVQAQGGDVETILHPELLPTASMITDLKVKNGGYLKKIHTEHLGLLAMHLGAGRATKEDEIDFAVGIVFPHKIGELLQVDESLFIVHHNQPLKEEWIKEIYEAIEISSEPVKTLDLIYKIL